MSLMNKHIFLLAIAIFIQTLYACEMYRFAAVDGRALTSHVMKTITHHLVNLCWSDCVWLPWCFSINIKKTSEGMFECELNNSSVKAYPERLVSRYGWSYHEMKNLSPVNCKVYDCKRKEDLGNGWLRYGDAAIKLFKEKKTWTDARNHCQSLGGDLLSITSSHENDFVNDVFVESLNLTYIQEAKKFTLPHIHLKLNGDDSEEIFEKGNEVNYTNDGREKALYLDGQVGYAGMPSTNLNPDGFTLLFWFKVLEPLELAYIFRMLKNSIKILRFRFGTGNYVNYIKLSYESTDLGTVRFDSNSWQYFCFSWKKNTTTIHFGKNGAWTIEDKNSVTSMETSNILFRFGHSINRFHGFYKHLVIVNSTISRHKIQTIMYWHEQGVWIGLNNPEGSAGFSWSDGTPVGQFMNLPDYNPEPNKSGRKCVAMAKDKKWLDKHCDLKYPFLCEKPVQF